MKRDNKGKFVSQNALLKYYCDYCGNVIYRYKSVKTKEKYCNNECRKNGLIGKKRKKHNIINYNTHFAIVIKSLKYGTKEVLIDNQDVELCSNYTWHLKYSKKNNSFYVQTHYLDKKIKLHRLITNCPDGMVVDHINHNTLDNRRENLKVCMQIDNQHNLRLQRNNTSGCSGVVYNKCLNKWIARIQNNYKVINLGCFNNKEDAILARKFAEIKYWNKKELV